ncbi:hypothetical protein BDF22DRAFT_696671 [Syncephalis plumigaleata]|nr:hypothetical protein BDF22DRAFT_696671 [Syncephalis plumigaleata]
MPIPTPSVHPADASPDHSPLRPFSRSAMTGNNERGINIPSTSTTPIPTSSMARSLDRDSITTVYSRPSSDGTWATRFDVVASSSPSSASSAENHPRYNNVTASATATRVDGESSCGTDAHVQQNIPLATPVAAHVTTATPRTMMTTTTMVKQPQPQPQPFPHDSSSDDEDNKQQQQHAHATDLLALRQQLNEAESALIENVSQWQFHWHEMAEVERLRRLVRESEQRMALNNSSSPSAAVATTTTTTTTSRKSLSRNNSNSRRATKMAAATRRRSSSYGQTHMPMVGCLPLNFTSGFRRSIDRAFSNPRRSLEDETTTTTTTAATRHPLSHANDDHHARYPVNDQSSNAGGVVDIANSPGQSVPGSRIL